MATPSHIPINNTPNEPYKGSAIIRLYKPATIFPISFLLHHLHPYLSCDTRGAGTLYNTKKARYYLLSLGLSTSFGPETNNFMEKLCSIKQRIDSDNHNDCYTKTYIQFSSGNHVIYLGFHLRCGSDKKYYADELKRRAQTKEVKHVHSNRLGISYDVIIKSVKGASDFDIVRSPQQIQRFKRLSIFILKQNVDCAIKKPFLLQATTDRDKRPITVLKQIHNCPKKQQPPQFHVQDITNRFNINPLPPLSPNFSGDAIVYYKSRHNLNLNLGHLQDHYWHDSLALANIKHYNDIISHIDAIMKYPEERVVTDVIPDHQDDDRTFIILKKVLLYWLHLIHDSAATITPADINCASASQPLAYVNFTPESSRSPRILLPDRMINYNFIHRSSSDDIDFFDV
ncbi:hypothetical protein GLOIN_2v1779171 [Rhizophagus clarus]|uniref:Uncharacterized protein n=1 Tax=Rhizophagus clarus TaxID=94130 RepID=A0A8H3R3U6_9GLOM|nr:hypothetical protein GLOIN_2v1779171 [Rhizophagus clarus]